MPIHQTPPQRDHQQQDHDNFSQAKNFLVNNLRYSPQWSCTVTSLTAPRLTDFFFEDLMHDHEIVRHSIKTEECSISAELKMLDVR